MPLTMVENNICSLIKLNIQYSVFVQSAPEGCFELISRYNLLSAVFTVSVKYTEPEVCQLNNYRHLNAINHYKINLFFKYSEKIN